MYPVGIGFLESAFWSPGPAQNIPPSYRSGSQALTVNVRGTIGEDHDYEIVACNILNEDTVPSAVLSVRCYGTISVRLFWLPVAGAVRYKILRNLRLVDTVGAVESRDAEYPNFQSYYDRGSQEGERYTRVVFPCQLLLPFEADGSLPSQG